MKYKIEITETLQKTIEIEADNAEDALSKVIRKYKDSEIILADTSYIDTEFKVVE
jgi:hypothetical protein